MMIVLMWWCTLLVSFVSGVGALELHQLSKFPRYTACHQERERSNIMPTFVVSNASQYSSIHRFFDSSPFSPSGRYIAMTRFHSANVKGTLPSGGTGSQFAAEIVVVDLMYDNINNREKIIDTTYAWGSQVGAHVQWGSNDNELFYNVVDDRGRIRGVRHNIIEKSKFLLDCPIYHVSASGKFAVSPNMSKIQYTQLGYGVDSERGSGSAKHQNVGAPEDDGLFLTDTLTGRCKLLVSLKELCSAAGLDTTSTPSYGFHAKWSGDDSHILFVVRTLNTLVEDTGLARLASMFREPKRVRTQHLFVMAADGGSVRHIISWASKVSTVFTKQNERPSADGVCFVPPDGKLLDGNHPNWIPGALRVSMNLKQHAHDKHWSVAVFDLETSVPRPSKVLVNDHNSSYCKNGVSRRFLPRIIGSGHPNHALQGACTIMDAYSKEKRLFSKVSDGKVLADGCVPIRLTNVITAEESWPLQVYPQGRINVGNTCLLSVGSGG
jgi:hypothetical protein